LDYDKKLQELYIELPFITPGMGVVSQFALIGKELIISPQLPIADGRLVEKGRVGAEVNLDRARHAARVACIWNLAIIAHHCKGTLNKVSKIISIDIDIAAGVGFYDHDKVADGASSLIEEIFGANATHMRTIRGVANLQKNSTLQVGMRVLLK